MFIRDTGRYYQLGATLAPGQVPMPLVEPTAGDKLPVMDNAIKPYKGWQIESLMVPMVVYPPGEGPDRFLARKGVDGQQLQLKAKTMPLLRAAIDAKEATLTKAAPVEEKTPSQPAATSEGTEKAAAEKANGVTLNKKHLLVGGLAAAGLLLLMR